MNLRRTILRTKIPDDRREDIIEIIEGISQVTVFDLSKIFYVSERTIERDLKKLN